MQRTDFHFDLPKELIAQRPAIPRSASRLLQVESDGKTLRDLHFSDLPELLSAADLLVFNDTRVVPARVHRQPRRAAAGSNCCSSACSRSRRALVHARASKGLKPRAVVKLPGGHTARMLERDGELFLLEFSGDVLGFFEAHGEIPLPPYIDRAPESADRERYQTVYARAPGAVAAPTAGLHFDAAIFAALEKRGVRRAFVTLHVGAGTFQPVRVDDIEEHEMHAEYLEVPATACAAINATRAAGGRVIAVGTTVVRSLETAAAEGVPLRPYRGATRIFIKPGYRFRVVDAMVTNFHLPESTLMMLCSAFIGKDRLLAAYAHAIEARYRFFSYGDAMFLNPPAATVERT